MNNYSRTKNAILNIFFGYFAQISLIILTFIGRKVFLEYLSIDYLGINGLYTNILTFLSLPELGLDAAVIYTLYKPVAENNTKLVSTLVSFFKKIYRYIAITIFTLGMLLVPFLPKLVSSTLSEKDLIAYYVLFLINTVLTYLIAHKVALLMAYQENRIIKIISIPVNLFLQLLYIIVLILWRDYYVYILASIISTIINNLLLSYQCNKIHKDIFQEQEKVYFDRNEIKNRFRSTLLYKLGAALINSTDNILISIVVSTVAVGYYSNYVTIINAIQGFIGIISLSLISGIGNLAVGGNYEKQSELFYFLLFVYHIIGAIGFIGISLLVNNVLTFWLGNGYVLDDTTVYIIAGNFYLTNIISPVWMFREANGCYDKVKYVLLFRALLNLFLSILLGNIYGIFGILLATALSLIFTNFWIEPMILMKYVLYSKVRHYWCKQFYYSLITFMCFFILNLLIKSSDITIINFIAKSVTIVGFVCTAFTIFTFKTDECKKSLVYINKIVRRCF
ncbi:lipopolysaccharide biosynthesis protein [uncultured Phascolarctobacterium sp.]|jgi:O-antigen/teichoic acid export membrane protein|uniref:lipopolysaccharide biosynthesis protein n=1 Tax=uncultured Phascolarctobacterium sp. TaxID=512296 RepID=UPI0025E1C0AD|nr:hypothetical protein [uncultured Phascolarctobacterium sp.]